METVTVVIKRAPSAGKQNFILDCGVVGSDVVGELLGLADGLADGLAVGVILWEIDLGLQMACCGNSTGTFSGSGCCGR